MAYEGPPNIKKYPIEEIEKYSLKDLEPKTSLFLVKGEKNSEESI